MIKKYCDRCGKKIFDVPDYINCQTNYIGGVIKFEIYRMSLMLGEPMKRIDLCSDCSLKLEQAIKEFLDEPKTITKKAFAKAHECCGGCTE